MADGSGWQWMAVVGLADDDSRWQTMVADGWQSQWRKKWLMQSEKKVIGKDKIEGEKNWDEIKSI